MWKGEKINFQYEIPRLLAHPLSMLLLTIYRYEREKFAFLNFLFPNLSSVFKDDRTLCKTSFRCYFSRLLYSHKELRMNTASLIMVLALFLTMKATTGQPSDIIRLFVMPFILLLE